MPEDQTPEITIPELDLTAILSDDTSPEFEPLDFDVADDEPLESEPTESTNDNETPEQAEDDEQADENASSSEIELNGVTYTLDQLAELVSKGADYTRKTQEIAEQRRLLEQESRTYRELDQALETKDGFRSVLQALADQYSEMHGERPDIEVLDPEALSEEGATLLSAMRKQEERTKAAIGQMLEGLRAEFGDVLSAMKPVIERQRADAAVKEAVSKLRNEKGIVASEADVRQAMKETGIADPIQAYAMANLGKGQQTKAQKPVSPKSGSSNARSMRTMTADQIFAAKTRGEALVD